MNDKKLPAFEDMGQVEVEFLGQRIVIGCVEGKEQKALRLAERFEIRRRSDQGCLRRDRTDPGHVNGGHFGI